MSNMDPPATGEESGLTRNRSRRYAVAGVTLEAPPAARGLHVVATPIGNLRDVTLRALEVLAGVDLIACEDTRVTRRLIGHYGIMTPLTPYHDHNAAAARPRLLERLGGGSAIALVSDAGTPLISDPGYRLVRAAREAGHLVTTVPGPSSVIAALAIAGLATDRFLFDGYLPAKSSERRARIAELAGIASTLVLFETGPRLAAALADLAAGLGARDAAICRELTKIHEEVRRGELVTLAAEAADAPPPRGEIVLVVAPPQAGAGKPGAKEVDDALRATLAHLSVKDAVAEVTALTGLPRRDIYRRALALRQEAENGTAE